MSSTGPGDPKTFDANGVLAASFDRSKNAIRFSGTVTSGGAPTSASYLTAVAEAALSNESVFGAVVFYPPDVVANRPAASSTIVGALYYATDTTALYRSDGVSAWTSVGGAGGSDKLGLTPTAVKTANYTASAGDFVPCNLATTGSFAVTFPTAPADGTVLAVKIIGTSAGRSLTLTLGGSDVFNIAGGVQSGSLSLLNQAALFQYKSSSAIWYTVATDIPLSQSDLRYLQAANNLSDLAARQTALNTLAGAVTNNLVLAGNGTNVTLRALAAADIPNLPESQITNLVSDLALKAPLASPALTGTPTAPTASAFTGTTQIATTAYVDNAINALDSKPDVAYASTSALPANTYANGSSGAGATLTANANGPLLIDGVTILVAQAGQRVLVAGESTSANNGWYTITQVGVVAVSPYILTRATESDQAAEIGAGYLTGVVAPNTVTPGSSNNGKVFISIAADPFTVGTTALTFSQVGGTYSAGNGIGLSGSTFSIDTAITVDKTTAQTLTNKTLTSPAITTPTGIVKGDVGLGNVTNNAQVQLATATTKGDLFVATASATVARQGVGSDTNVLIADSTQTNGIKWGATPSDPLLYILLKQQYK